MEVAMKKLKNDDKDEVRATPPRRHARTRTGGAC